MELPCKSQSLSRTESPGRLIAMLPLVQAILSFSRGDPEDHSAGACPALQLPAGQEVSRPAQLCLLLLPPASSTRFPI